MEYYASRKRRRFPLRIIIVLVLPIIIFASFVTAMMPLAVDAAVYRGRAAMTQLLQSAVIENLPQDMSYGDFVDMEFDDDKRVTAIQVKSTSISRMQAEMTSCINRKLLDYKGAEISLPLGTLTGIWIFNGHGPEISFYTAPISAVTSQIHHRFESAGINQTRHSIELEMRVDAQTLLFGSRTPFEVSTRIVLSDTIVVGVTPEMFAQLASGYAM